MRLTIGEMSCLEYAAMMGHTELLRVLLEKSMHVMILQKYFSTPGQYFISECISKSHHLFAKTFNLNFHSLEVVSR